MTLKTFVCKLPSWDKRSLVIISLVYRSETNPIYTPAMVIARLYAHFFRVAPASFTKPRHVNPQTYGPTDYVSEFGLLVAALGNDTQVQNRSMLIGPNIAGTWTPEQVWNTGFVQTYSSSLSALAVEKYPTDNCAAQFGIGQPVNAQDIFPNFLNHTSGQNIVNPYLNSTNFAQTMQKPFLMFETNTASCGGFAGLSDSFGAALWGADYALQMAYSNFSGALFHVGGESVFYNVSRFRTEFPEMSGTDHLMFCQPFTRRSASPILRPNLTVVYSSTDQPVFFPPMDGWAYR